MEKITINHANYQVDDILDGFKIFQPKSSNVDWIGHNGKDQVFAVFKSGSTYIYNEVDSAIINAMGDQEYRSLLISNIRKILGKYKFSSITKLLIIPADY